MINVLFVCLGNICRSPLAEGILSDIVKKEGLQDKIHCDSAGTSRYHLGKLPDERMRKTAMKRGIDLVHLGREAVEEDLFKFDYLLAMDAENYEDLKIMEGKTSHNAKICLMRDFDPLKNIMDVPDPYYGGEEGFEEVYEILYRCNVAFVDYLKKEHSL